MLIDLENKCKRWINNAIADESLIEELKSIENNQVELESRFSKNLEFGTGGLRGILGVGTNRMNIYTVGKVTQGLANYLNQNFKKPSVAIAYDSRINSKLFAEHAASILAANKIKVYIYPDLMPTPSLSFAVRYLKCSAGIVITASHNPKKYNGYKVYGEDGCQITLKAAREIQTEIEKVDEFDDVKIANFEKALNDKFVSYIENEVTSAFLSAVDSQAINKNVENKKNLKIVYTPLNGTGLACVTSALKQNGYTNINLVEFQKDPDGNFPTCPYPNPEEKDALNEGIKLCKKINADILLATDPDCDRVGIAVKHNDDYSLLSGNEVGVLLFDYICKTRTNLKSMPKNPVCIKTIVTTDMVFPIAEKYGVEIIETLTGFKFIGEQIGLLEKSNKENRYIFGFEESYGYLPGTYARDKDAVAASLLICEMATYYKNLGKDLVTVLEELFDQHGHYYNKLINFSFDNNASQEKILTFMENLKTNHNSFDFLNKELLYVSDYLFSTTYFTNGITEKITLPKSNVLKFVFKDKTTITIRPSGTEPKLKIYVSSICNNKEFSLLIDNIKRYIEFNIS